MIVWRLKEPDLFLLFGSNRQLTMAANNATAQTTKAALLGIRAIKLYPKGSAICPYPQKNRKNKHNQPTIDAASEISAFFFIISLLFSLKLKSSPYPVSIFANSIIAYLEEKVKKKFALF
ncbi:MAG TPA: hypothetical protein ENN28_00085 [Candidatus Uhrbacteria bacterium]|nr:hypothetical protein [Candidatus Uhrbacteria bacterium]